MTSPTRTPAGRVGDERPGSALRRLIEADTKDLVRTLQTGFATLFLFGFFLLVIGSLDLLLGAGSSAPKVTVTSTDTSFVSDLTAALDQRDVLVSAEPTTANLFVQENDGRVTVVVSAEENPSWHSTWRAVRSVGVSVNDITVTDTDGAWRAGILQQNLAPAIGMGFMAIVFVGTVVPLVTMRELGTLRLLGATPVRNSMFILSLIPARSVFALVEVAVVLVVASARSYLDPGMLWRLAISMVLSLVMLFPLAFLIGARARNAANMQQLMVTLTMLLVGLGGGFLPAQIIAGPIQVVFNMLPTTWMIQAIGADLTGTQPFTSVYVLWLLMIVVAVVALALASRMFSWDRESQSGWRAASSE